MCLSGHKHKLWPFIPGQVDPEVFQDRRWGGYLTDFNFPGFLVGRRSLTIEGGTQSDGYDQYTGLHVRADLSDGVQMVCYLNSLGEILKGENFFTGETFEVIRLEMKRSK